MTSAAVMTRRVVARRKADSRSWMVSIQLGFTGGEFLYTGKQGSGVSLALEDAVEVGVIYAEAAGGGP